MKFRIKEGLTLIFIPFLLLLFSNPALAKTMYVKSFKIKLTATPQHSSKALLTLKRGEQVKIIKTENSWVKISFKNTEGWVHKFALSKKVPRKRISLLHRKVDITSKARKRASSFTSAAAARGLVNSKDNKLVAKHKQDFVALANMESVIVDPEDAIFFISQDE